MEAPRRAAGTEVAAEERDAVGSDGGGRDGGGGGRLANVEGGRNVRIITRTLWNPWHRGDGKRGRQIRTIAGVSRTALSVMVVVLFPSSSRCVPFSHPLRARAFPPSRPSRSPGFSRSSLAPNLSRARNIQNPRPDPCKLPPLSILASVSVQFLPRGA